MSQVLKVLLYFLIFYLEIFLIQKKGDKFYVFAKIPTGI